MVNVQTPSDVELRHTGEGSPSSPTVSLESLSRQLKENNNILVRIDSELHEIKELLRYTIALFANIY
jgi:hypothetical protein